MGIKTRADKRKNLFFLYFFSRFPCQVLDKWNVYWLNFTFLLIKTLLFTVVSETISHSFPEIGD